jgi:hypothetical protein
MFRIKGSGREIVDPVYALIMQAEQITAAAMHTDLLRSIVRLFRSSAGKKIPISSLITPVPAPRKVVSFTADKIKRDVVGLAVDKLGVDRSNIPTSALIDPWTEIVKVYMEADKYNGKDNIMSIVINGERQWFEVSPKLFEMANKLNRHDTGAVEEASRKLISLMRMGATGLNPTFGLVRNMLRDLPNYYFNRDYGTINPITAIKQLMELAEGSEDVDAFDSSGVQLSTFVGQDMNKVKHAEDKLTQGRLENIVRHPLEALQALFGFTELLPRWLEYKGALEFARKNGYSERDTNILAAIAAKDVTINFSRAGELGRTINNFSLFFNARVQGIDKTIRTIAKHPGRSLSRAAPLTAVAMVLYMLNKGDKDWEELPPHEKWSYLHFKIPGTNRFIRTPLPDLAGYLFASLPVAAVAGKDSFAEAMGRAAKGINPIDIPSAFKPMLEVVTNESWAGYPIVSERNKRKLPEDQYDDRTSEFSKFLGQNTGISPSQMEYLLTQYSGGLYKRVVDMAKIGQAFEDPSNLPLAGTLFTRAGTSRLSDDFYSALENLEEKHASGKATLTEYGKIRMAGRFKDRVLNPLYAEAEELRKQDTPAARERLQEVKLAVNDAIRGYNSKLSDTEARQVALGGLAYSVSGEEAPEDKDLKLTSGVGYDELKTALRNEWLRRGYKANAVNAAGNQSPYGERLERIRRRLVAR